MNGTYLTYTTTLGASPVLSGSTILRLVLHSQFKAYKKKEAKICDKYIYFLLLCTKGSNPDKTHSSLGSWLRV